MTNPENVRLSTEERGLQQSEETLGRQEQGLWQRLAALDADDLDGRAAALLGRIGALEAGGSGSPDLTRLKSGLTSLRVVEPPIATAERGSALSARRGAQQQREVALKATTAAVTQFETSRQGKKKEIDAVDAFIGSMEKALQQALERRRAAQAGGTPGAGTPKAS